MWFLVGCVSFFQNEVGDAVTVNRTRYRTMTTDYMQNELEGIHFQNIQQDGTIFYTWDDSLKGKNWPFLKTQKLVSTLGNITPFLRKEVNPNDLKP